MNFRIAATAVSVLLWGVPNAWAVSILGNFIGGTQQGPSVGGGNIFDIFNAAASTWENAIRDPFELSIDYGWGPDPGGYHFLQSQGGTPNRETHGLILVQPQVFSPGNFSTLFMDPTPRLNEEFLPEGRLMQDLGGGMLTVGRILTASSDAPPELWTDLYSVLLHEIGHALGLSMGNTSFISEAADGVILVGPDLPFAGSVIPLATNNFGVTSHLDVGVNGPVMSGLGFNDRRLPSAVDVLANAQISGFTQLSFEATAIPEPSTLILVGLGFGASAVARIRRRRTKQKVAVDTCDTHSES
jgi:PEP-CTERM motif